MQRHQGLRSDLDDCVLEDRVAPAVTNLGVMVLTTSGYVLVIPFPGAYVVPGTASGGFGPNTAGGVSGVPINTSFFIMGFGGMSSVQPGNFTGFPSLVLAGSASSSGGATVMIGAGTGANDAASVSIPPVTRNTIANDRLNPLPVIGGVSTYQSPFLPAGQLYRKSTRLNS